VREWVVKWNGKVKSTRVGDREVAAIHSSVPKLQLIFNRLCNVSTC
jgi:hypothetical protein